MKFSFFDIFNESNPIDLSPHIAFVFSPHYNLSLEAHVFPAHKFTYLHEMLLLDDTFNRAPYFEPEKPSRDLLEMVHTKEYIDDFLHCKITERTKFSELPLNISIVESFLYSVGGTILASELTDKYRYVYNLGGGFHHSYADHAEGFCYLNDVAIACKVYQKKNPGKKVLVIDLDLHQGNGTSVIFQKDESVFTFSMHQENIYPVKEKSDLDIPLPENCKDADYSKYLLTALDTISLKFQPDLIFYLAGADPFKEDTLGDLKLTIPGLIQRDRIVKEYADKNNCPVVIVTAGGYAKNFRDTVTIHYNTARLFGLIES